MARGASEREIETEVVHVLKRAGWPRSQINQDVPISDKGADKADIVLRLDNQPVILVEVKRYGQARDADNQVNRYCRLLRPSPKLALLTDGARWVLYYVGQSGTVPIHEATVPSETALIISMLNTLSPERLSVALHAGVFQYLDIVEQGLQERSEDTQRHLRPFFASTANTLLMSDESLPARQISAKVSPITRTASAQEQTEQAHEGERQSHPHEGNEQRDYDPAQPPGLAFTTLITASFGGDKAINWNDLLRVAVRTALVSGQTKHDIMRLTNINVMEEAITDRGYSPLTGTNLSIQGLTADEAWQNALKLAKRLECVIEARFRWRENEKAFHPGVNGVLRWQP